MHRFGMMATLAVAFVALVALSPASAQYVYYPPPAPVVTYSYYTPVPPPVTTVYYASPTVTYYPPVATTVYAAPPAPVVYGAPGTVTTRTFVGLGIFRPRGVYTQSYYTPGVSYYVPAYYR
jgi:hypothetical protein